MFRTIARTLGRTAVILIAAGVVVFAAWAVSNSALASSMTPQGGPPAAVLEQQTQSTSSDEIVLADEETGMILQPASAQSADGTTTDTTAQTQTERPMRGEGGPGGDRDGGQGWIVIAKNAGIILGISALVAVIQTAFKRIKRTRKTVARAAA